MYNSQASAKQKGLVSIAKNGAVKLGVSTQQYQSLRDSVRLVSKQTFVSVPRKPPSGEHLTDGHSFRRCPGSLEEASSCLMSTTFRALKAHGRLCG